MANTIKQIVVTNASTNEKVTVNAALTNLFIDPEKQNLRLESSDELGGKNIVLKSKKDIKIKPQDDLSLYSEYRTGKEDEFSVKVLDGSDVPVKLQLNTSEITLTTKDKTGSNANVMDITVNSEPNTRGYLKVRAQAIDLRSESHGGIALQPKGSDSDGNMNKIKFEHGGGDGLEFGTFNTEKTSIFTDEYRFNKYGTWKMATREKEASNKKDTNDQTTYYKYKKQGDDFYDIIDINDEQCTTNDIIKTANAFNGSKNRHAKVTSSGNIEIATVSTYVARIITDTSNYDSEGTISRGQFSSWQLNKAYTESEIETIFLSMYTNEYENEGDDSAITVKQIWDSYNRNTFCMQIAGEELYLLIEAIKSPSINIESDKDVKIYAKSDIVLETGDGDTDRLNISKCPHIYAEYKISKKGALQGSDPVFISAITNNLKDNNIAYTGDVTSNLTQSQYDELTGDNAPVTGEISCKLSDVVKLVNYMKTQNLGPWAQATE